LSGVLAAYPKTVADCSDLCVGQPFELSAIARAQERAGGWPGSRLCLYRLGPNLEDWYRASRLSDQVPVRDTMRAAVAALDERPRVVRRSAALSGRPSISQRARGLIAGCRRDWSLSNTVAACAALTASELAIAAVEAGSTAVHLIVELTPVGLALVVLERTPVPTGGLGSLTVATLDELAGSWSSVVTQYGRRTRATFGA
jgi:hypothetical protein